MKKIIHWILWPLIFAAGIIVGFLARQPSINKLKKQVKQLQKNNSRLLVFSQLQHDEFRDLRVQHKALKAFSFGKKASFKDKLRENLILQYAVKSYIDLLMKRVKYEQELSKSEIAFFNAFDNIIDGKKLSTSSMVTIRDYILERYSGDIDKLKECDYTLAFQVLNEYQ